MRRSKKKCQQKHVMRRARERFSIHLSESDYLAIVDLIQDNKGIFIERQSHRITVWLVKYNGTNMIAVYDKERGTIATVLPLHYYKDVPAVAEALKQGDT